MVPNIKKLTIATLCKIGVNHSFALFDGGYFSEDNVKALYENKIDFLTRMPSFYLIFKNPLATKKCPLYQNIRHFSVMKQTKKLKFSTPLLNIVVPTYLRA